MIVRHDCLQQRGLLDNYLTCLFKRRIIAKQTNVVLLLSPTAPLLGVLKRSNKTRGKIAQHSVLLRQENRGKIAHSSVLFREQWEHEEKLHIVLSFLENNGNTFLNCVGSLYAQIEAPPREPDSSEENPKRSTCLQLVGACHDLTACTAKPLQPTSERRDGWDPP